MDNKVREAISRRKRSYGDKLNLIKNMFPSKISVGKNEPDFHVASEHRDCDKNE